ncbi:MAG: peptide chain release factor N(5)-glutamine methyltransferase [Candidatus Obscuribacterales bacterium]|nr:peptide chain release factor N(5)-glutamine methyltransferase [Candidatus Obscuribacterales bacterium]
MCSTPFELSQFLLAELKAIGIEDSEARAEAELIVRKLSGLSLSQRLAYPEKELDPSVLQAAVNILERRKNREPIQYCLGETYFYGLRFLLKPGVLIPRADTELLVETVLSFCQSRRNSREKIEIGEIGSGSGIISVSLLKGLDSAKLFACDISASAIEQTRINAEYHAVLSRLDLKLEDWLSWIDSKQRQFDVLVSNPPYIPLSQRGALAPELSLWEPEQALFGGDQDGLAFYRSFAKHASCALKPGARAFLEIGYSQSEAVQSIFRMDSWRIAAVHADLNGIDRVLSLIPPNSPF